MSPNRRVLRFRPPAPRVRPSKQGILYPFDEACRYAGVAVPVAKRTSQDRIPSPYAGLLVHQNGLTLALERHFGSIGMRVLAVRAKGWRYLRHVLLVREDSGRPVAMGTMSIDLGAFNPRVRARVLRADAAFGRILREARLEYRSTPRAFLEVTPSVTMMGVFWMREPQTLYGRQTEISIGGRKLGDIVEILPLV